MGLAASMGQFLLSAGARASATRCRTRAIMMHQPSGGIGGTAADIAIQAEQMLYAKKTLAERIALHTGQPLEQIEADSDRDRWFTAQRGQGLRLHRPRRAEAPGRCPDGRRPTALA